MIWFFAVFVAKWQSFAWLQLVGFVILIAGTFFYNEIVRIPGLRYPAEKEEEEDAAAVRELAVRLRSGRALAGCGLTRVQDQALVGDMSAHMMGTSTSESGEHGYMRVGDSA